MELYAKGQLSYLILTCMQERDFYGLDIISEISNKSNGRINLKKPSVYSNLTRMEKQGYITSYLQSSDFGPNRKYYSLTEKGRNFYQELRTYFEKNNIDVFRDFQDENEETQSNHISSPAFETKEENNDFFDFSSLTIEKKEENLVSNLENKEIETISEKIQENTQDSKQDDGVFISNENVEDYNRRLYDISKDINKIKRKRSFADDQISMTATAPLVQSNEKTKSNIEDFKNSLLENKEKYQENRTNSFEYFKTKEKSNFDISTSTLINSNNKVEEVKDDAKFITSRIDLSQIERARKIEPPKIKIVSENTKDSRLPAPNRDKTIDPSHKEILNKLYSRTKDESSPEIRDDAIYDYNDLKDYYRSQDISFNVYQKNMEKTNHNTNKLYLINSLIIFGIASLLSASIFLILNAIGFTNAKTNFMYVLLPALLIIDVGYNLYNYKSFSSWIPNQIRPQWQILLSYILSSFVVAGLNFAFGMATKPFYLFATSLILPLVILTVIFPIAYWLKKFIIVKFWK